MVKAISETTAASPIAQMQEGAVGKAIQTYTLCERVSAYGGMSAGLATLASSATAFVCALIVWNSSVLCVVFGTGTIASGLVTASGYMNGLTKSMRAEVDRMTIENDAYKNSNKAHEALNATQGLENKRLEKAIETLTNSAAKILTPLKGALEKLAQDEKRSAEDREAAQNHVTNLTTLAESLERSQTANGDRSKQLGEWIVDLGSAVKAMQIFDPKAMGVNIANLTELQTQLSNRNKELLAVSGNVAASEATLKGLTTEIGRLKAITDAVQEKFNEGLDRLGTTGKRMEEGQSAFLKDCHALLRETRNAGEAINNPPGYVFPGEDLPPAAPAASKKDKEEETKPPAPGADA